MFKKTKLKRVKIQVKLFFLLMFPLICMATGDCKLSKSAAEDMAFKEELQQESKTETTNSNNFTDNQRNETIFSLCNHIDNLPKGNLSLNDKERLKRILSLVPHEDPLSICLFNKEDDIPFIEKTIINKCYINSIPMFSDIEMKKKGRATSQDIQRAFEEFVKNGLSIRYVPEEYKTNEFFCRVLMQNSGFFEYIPANKITPEICSAMCLINPEKLSCIPSEFRSYELTVECLKGTNYLTRVQQESLINAIPNEFYDNLIKENILSILSGVYYPYNESSFDDNLINHFGVNKNSLFVNFDDTDLSELSLIDKRLWHLNMIISEPICNISKLGGIYVEDEEFWQSATERNGLVFKYALPCKYKNNKFALCATKAKKNPAFSYRVLGEEVKFINIPIYSEALKKSLNLFNRFHMIPCPELDEDLFLPFCFRDFKLLLSFTASNKLGALQKCKLIEKYNKLDIKSSSFYKIDYSNLYNNPHSFHLDAPNPSLDELIYTCYSNIKTTPHASYIGQHLKIFTDKFIKETKFKPITNEDYFNLQSPDIKVCGGRSCSLKSNNKLLNYKFIRSDEEVSCFLKEAAIHDFIGENNLIPKSGAPAFKSVFRVKYHDFHKSIFKNFKDELSVTRIDCIDYCYGYCFETDLEYNAYAHVVDSSSSYPFIKAEIGMEKAAYDMGAWMCMGVFFPDILPCFHNWKNKRTWLALPSLFGSDNASTPYYQLSSYAGVLNAWNTTATEMPDIGRSGLRDLGDHEIFPNLTQASNSINGCCVHPPGVATQAHMAEYISKYIITQVLLYGRLRQQSKDFHYKNEESLELTKKFIHTITESFLHGYQDTALQSNNNEYVQRERLNLEEFLDIGEHFLPCMQRMSLEIVYWLAKQPTFVDGKLEYDGDELSQFDPKDCYAQHMVDSADLSTELYEQYNIFQYYSKYSDSILDVQRVFPHDFYNNEKKLSLGAVNGLFPLITLMNVCQKFCTELFKFIGSCSKEND